MLRPTEAMMTVTGIIVMAAFINKTTLVATVAVRMIDILVMSAIIKKIAVIGTAARMTAGTMVMAVVMTMTAIIDWSHDRYRF
ncbi:hypothetical protein [Halothiobacillus sp.]|uniref:hypothetical protein n=1 Tax=Halothiobacillus sp. TaxID=1891311 RepID=UPI00261BA242|nr:hypothetical protein [Halothiobacillus sp.]